MKIMTLSRTITAIAASALSLTALCAITGVAQAAPKHSVVRHHRIAARHHAVAVARHHRMVRTHRIARAHHIIRHHKA